VLVTASLKRNKKNRVPLAKFIRESKDNKPCSDCKREFRYYVLDFDHVGEKSFLISTAAKAGVSLERIAAEIAKCDIVCANCHRERTFKRLVEKNDESLPRRSTRG